ncbi:MAG: type IV pilus modification protein PilV [Rhodocyclaceae bacterium]|nr:type IV pilus modification protein PilV [Rhodocyclaceae bacterium]MBR4736483.1 type IV pilus modification protein PilV [Rhodocyclaceae bacterium]
MKHSARTTRVSQQGTSLLEVLISLLILAVGMLGMAGLQTNALKSSQSAGERSSAILHTYSIASVLQADRLAAQSYQLAAGAPDPAGTTFLTKSVAKWRSNLRQELGDSATGAISCTAANDASFGSCSVTITWDDSRIENSTQSFSLTTEIPL